MAWTHTYEASTDLSAEALWPVLTGVGDWPEVDHNIAHIEVDGPIQPGATFRLQPKGGPKLHFEVAVMEPPLRWGDRCLLPGAAMTTVHAFSRVPTGTHIRVDIEITGPLSWLWGWMVGRTHASGLPAQTDRFITRARKLAARD